MREIVIEKHVRTSSKLVVGGKHGYVRVCGDQKDQYQGYTKCKKHSRQPTLHLKKLPSPSLAELERDLAAGTDKARRGRSANRMHVRAYITYKGQKRQSIRRCDGRWPTADFRTTVRYFSSSTLVLLNSSLHPAADPYKNAQGQYTEPGGYVAYCTIPGISHLSARPPSHWRDDNFRESGGAAFAVCAVCAVRISAPWIASTRIVATVHGSICPVELARLCDAQAISPEQGGISGMRVYLALHEDGRSGLASSVQQTKRAKIASGGECMCGRSHISH